MKKKKALKQLEAAIRTRDQFMEHNVELRRAMIQLTRRLEDGQAWANAATSRIREMEAEIENRKIGVDERIEALTAMNEEAGRVLRDKTQALQIANETIRRREQVIEYYARKFGGGPDPDDIGDDRERRADGDDDDDGDQVTISFSLVGIDEEGIETEIGRGSKTFPINVGQDDPKFSHCGDPDCEICNAVDAAMNGDPSAWDAFANGAEEKRQRDRRRVFAELGEVLDQAARVLNRPFTNGKGVQSWELRGQLAALQIEFAQLNANDLGQQDDPPAYRALRKKIVEFARGVRELTGEDFGGLLTWGNAQAIKDEGGGRLWERLQAAMGRPEDETAQTNSAEPTAQQQAAAEWWKNSGGGIEGLQGRVAAFRRALEAEKDRTVAELEKREEAGELSGAVMADVISGAISRAARAAQTEDAPAEEAPEPIRQRMRRAIFEQMRELNRQEEAPTMVGELQPAGRLSVHVHETVNAAGFRILEVENVRAAVAKRFYIMTNAAGVPELVPLLDE